MKKKMCLTLFMVATMLATNLTITPQSTAPSGQKASWKQQVRRNWACLRGPKKNNCSKQDVARARKWVAGASAAAIAVALVAAGITAITIKAVLKAQEDVKSGELIAGGESPIYEDMPRLERINKILDDLPEWNRSEQCILVYQLLQEEFGLKDQEFLESEFLQKLEVNLDQNRRDKFKNSCWLLSKVRQVR